MFPPPRQIPASLEWKKIKLIQATNDMGSNRMERLIPRLIACLLPYALWAGSQAQAAPGDWDRSYGQNGRLSFEIPGVTFTVHDWLQQPDGRIVIVGHTTNSAAFNENSELIVARFNANGTPDTSFDGDGHVRFEFVSSTAGATNLERQSDGKLLVVGQAGIAYNEARLLRLNVDGSRDVNYGNGGEVSIRYPTSTTILNPMVKLAPDGAAILVGRFLANASNPLSESVVATRVTSAGTIDASFGTAGNAFLQGSSNLFPEAVSIGADGSIVVGGAIGPYNNASPFIGRLMSTGQPASFGTGGVVIVPFLTGEGAISSLVVTANGQVVAAGIRHDNYGNALAFVARFNGDGTLDPTFGSAGRIVSAASGIASILVESDGKIVVAGGVNEQASSAFLARYNNDGSPDVAFGSRGISRTDFGTGTIVSSSLLRLVKRNADGSYSALVELFSYPSSPSVGYGLARFLAQGSSAGVLGIQAEFESYGVGSYYSVSEETPTQKFNVYRSGGADGTVSVQYRTVSDTAIAGQDFVARTGTVTLNDGERSASFEVQILDDAIPENNFDEEFHVELFGPTGGAGLSKQRATIRIFRDEDFGQHVQVFGDGAKFLEGGTARALAYRSGDMRGPLTLNYTITAGTAGAGSDYTGIGGTLQWPANEGGAREVSVALVNDATAESAEQFTITFADAAGVVTGVDPATITITDDDDVSTPSVAFASTSVYVDENTGFANFTVHRLGDTTQAMNVPWQMSTCSGEGAATAPQDYTASSGTLSWQAGEPGPKSFSIALTDDSSFEMIESCGPSLDLFSIPSLNDTNARFIIKDNDGTPGQPVASLGSATVVSEGTSTFMVPVSLSGLPASPVPVSVEWQADGGTASPQNDFSATNGILTWAAGDNATKNISITINDDPRDETDETFVINLLHPRYGLSIGTSRQRFTITDDDPTPAGQSPPVPPGVEVVSEVSVSEGQRTAAVELRRVGDTTGTVAAIFNPVDATAGSPGDYFVRPGNLIWVANETETKRIEVQINGDAMIEPTESLSMNVTTFSIFGDIPPASIPITITDDDASAPPAHVGFINPTALVSESATTVTVQVGRTGNTSIASSVDFATTAGSAGAADFTEANGTLTWAADDTSSKMITITLLPDAVDEPDDTFTISLRNASSGTLVDTATATVTIQDDDVPAPPPPPPPSGGSGGGGRRGGGAEGYLDMLMLAAALLMQRRKKL